jgi:hypothetical protein
MARSFNGTTDVITLGSAAVVGASFSLAAWINRTGVSSGPLGFFGGSVSGSIEVRVDGSTNNVTLLSQGMHVFTSSSGAITTGSWAHIGVTYDQSTVKYYINGSASGSFSDSTGIPTRSITAIGEAPSVGEFFPGSIADAVGWSVILTAQEFSSLGKGIRPSQIRPKFSVVWLPLDGLKSPEPDLSGNANNGTLTGTAAAFGPPLAPFTPRRPQALPPVSGLGWWPSPITATVTITVGRGFT